MEYNDLAKLIKPYLDKHNLILCDIEMRKEFGEKILSFTLDNQEGKITIDELSAANVYISDLLDSVDIDLENYLLEVASPGIEKPLKTYEEVMQAIGSYVCVELENEQLTGDLVECLEGELTLNVNHKGRFKKHKILYKDAKHIRLAIKF